MAATMPITSISRSPSTLSAAGPRKGAGAPSAAAAEEAEDDEDEDELLLLDELLPPPLPGAAAGGSSSCASACPSSARVRAVPARARKNSIATSPAIFVNEQIGPLPASDSR
jgi:hypothetical protein